uniref:F-box/FBD/LRR-repeat protein At4g26340 family n=1 Tax=Cajanus cajan TaxID=3821 RepID=A0A151RDF7_CAJCA|nr:F-box/FBD/LRR-repeat protein At4g26340 family [Cajanus cajan]
MDHKKTINANSTKHYLHRKCQGSISRTHFLNSVYRVLLNLDASSVHSFTLSLTKNYHSYHINQWISAILNRGVKELLIESNKNLDISSYSHWKSQSLEKLVLNMNGCAIGVPSFVCLSTLTVLKLTRITFTCQPSNDPKNLIIKLPVLREYEAENCSWLNVKDITFEVPLLEVLSITPAYESVDSHTIMKFCAPRLTKFSYSGYVSPISDTILLDIDLSRARNITGKILMNFLQNTPFLKTLLLQVKLLQFDAEHSNPENVSSCIISNLEVFKFGKLYDIEQELRSAKFVMEYAQVLKVASFSPRWDLRKSTFEKVKKKILSFKRSVSSMVIEFPPIFR